MEDKFDQTVTVAFPVGIPLGPPSSANASDQAKSGARDNKDQYANDQAKSGARDDKDRSTGHRKLAAKQDYWTPTPEKILPGPTQFPCRVYNKTFKKLKSAEMHMCSAIPVKLSKEEYGPKYSTMFDHCPRAFVAQ